MQNQTPVNIFIKVMIDSIIILVWCNGVLADIWSFFVAVKPGLTRHFNLQMFDIVERYDSVRYYGFLYFCKYIFRWVLIMQHYWQTCLCTHIMQNTYKRQKENYLTKSIYLSDILVMFCHKITNILVTVYISYIRVNFKLK